MKDKPGGLTSFLRYNVVAGLATSVDFLVLVVLTEVFHVWYLCSAFTGALTGGIVAFILERNWTFKKRDKRISIQAFKYLIAWASSILLNTWGLFFIVEHLGINYIISKIIVAIIVGIGFNFFTHKYLIFN